MYKIEQKQEKVTEMKVMSGFLSSSYSPVMANLAAGSSAWESASLTLDKRDSSESKLTASSEKCLVCMRLSLLSQCIGEENQGRLKNDKELKILGKDFKKQMEKIILLL